MQSLKPALLAILLAGSVAAQVPSSKPAAPDVTVVKISWQRGEHNPKLDNAPLVANPERALRMAVNTARTNEANSVSPVNKPNPPELLVVPAAPDPGPADPARSPFLYVFTVRNTGAKTITELNWQYVFTDPGTHKTVGRREYKSKAKIRPGLMANLVERSSLPPLGIIDATKAGQTSADQSPEQMVIQRIKYADGSVWERAPK